MPHRTTARRPFAVMAVLLVLWTIVANLAIGDNLYTARNLALTALLLGGWIQAPEPVGGGLQDLGLSRSSLAAGTRWGVSAALVIALAPAMPSGCSPPGHTVRSFAPLAGPWSDRVDRQPMHRTDGSDRTIAGRITGRTASLARSR